MTHLRFILGLASLCVLAISTCFAVEAQSEVPQRVTQAIDETSLTTLPGHIYPAANPANDRGPVDDSAPLGHIILMLRRSTGQQQDLDAFVDQLHNARSEQYHQWLTPAEFGRRFGPADQDVAAVADWLRNKGFIIEDMPPSKTHITFTGSVGQMRQAFHVDIHHLSVNGEAHQAAMNEPQIPSALAPVVAGFRQLHDFWPAPPVVQAGIFSKDLKSGKTTRVAGTTAGPRPELSIDFGGKNYYEVGPQDFYTIYNETSLLKANITGAGVTIAVIEQTEIKSADVTSFRSAFGLPAYPSTPNSTGGGVNYIYGSASGVGGDSACSKPLATSQSNGNEPEADIDVEWAGTVAPGAIIDFVACGTKSSAPGSEGTDLAAAHVANYLSSTVAAASLSYGECENLLGPTGEAFYKGLWEQFAAEGITAVVSSGDSGPDRCDQDARAAGNMPSVNGKSSSAYNVSAGGTDFGDAYITNQYATSPATTWWSATNGTGNSSAKSYIPETAWGAYCSNPLYISLLEFNGNTDYGTTYTPVAICNGAAVAGASNIQDVAGGGGGVSVDNTIPTWQSVYGVGQYSGSTTHRNLPDIALFAAAGFWGHFLPYCDSDRVACTYTDASNSFQLLGAGGTSFVAPQVAGLMALVNQKTGERQGQADYSLYNLAVEEYGTPARPNTTNLKDCSGSAKGAEVESTCIFRDIAADTPSLQGGNIASATLEPCYASFAPDCYTGGGSGPYGISSVPGASASTLAYYAGAGYDLTTGLGSVNIERLVEYWDTVSPGFASTTALSTSSASIQASGGVTLTATVTATGRGGAAAPAGVVQFNDGSTTGTLLGKGSIVAHCTGSGAATECKGVATLAVAGSRLHAGSNSIVAHFEGDGANDSPSTSPAVSVTDTGVSQTITFTGLPATATYGAAGPYTLKATGGASGNPVTFSLVSGPGAVSGSKLTITGAGVVVVAANQVGNSTYSAAAQVTQSITVDQAVLTVTAKNASRVYGAANPTFSYTITGFVNGDTQATATTGAPSLTTTATRTSPVGSYVITAKAGTLAARNYSFKFTNGTLTITPIGTAATPVFKPAAGTYTSAQSVTITDATAASTIYYTTNGDTPSTISTKYTTPISVSATETIKAIAVATGYTQSAVASAAYKIN